MTDNGEVTSTCDQCGASIYEQHLESGIAKRKDGKLFCSHCVAELTEAQGGDDDVSDDLAPIEFEDDNESSTVEMTSSRIHKGAETAPGAGGWDDERFKRPLDPKTSAASRCRTFHCRISQGAVDFLNEQVNDWLDQNKDITIKFSNTVIGMFEGKHTEPNLILTVFY